MGASALSVTLGQELHTSNGSCKDVGRQRDLKPGRRWEANASRGISKVSQSGGWECWLGVDSWEKALETSRKAFWEPLLWHEAYLE